VPWSSRKGTAAVYRTPEHRKARAALLTAFRPGDPCCLCGRPMYGPTSRLHADHDPVTGGYRGLSHERCNVRDGARRGRARQNVSRLRW
jgi:hypothetical protein